METKLMIVVVNGHQTSEPIPEAEARQMAYVLANNYHDNGHDPYIELVDYEIAKRQQAYENRDIY
jgi:hypothetical protein